MGVSYFMSGVKGKGGRKPGTYKHSEATLKKMREAWTPEMKSTMSKRLQGHDRMTPEVRAKVGAANTTHGLSRNGGTKEYIMWCAAKQRAKNKGLAFNIEVSDIVIPACCPLLGIPIFFKGGGQGSQTANSPALDRIKPALGYVKGNVWVISQKANTAKSDLSIDEMKLLVKNWEFLS
jgi:hypothetical protein